MYISALARFAGRTEKRLDGLIAHASHPASTGKLEGSSNRIKVAKRIAYGYRDEGCFFLIRADNHRGQLRLIGSYIDSIMS